MSVELMIARILFVCGFAVLGLLLARLPRIDASLGCMLAGVLAGFSLPWLMFDTGVRAHNMQDLVFYVILPVLIFEGAWYIKPALLRRWLAPTLLLAIPGVLFATAASGILIYLSVGHPVGFPLIAALLAGAIISATDPSAVIARLRQESAPEGLSTLMESESLFNDATAVVLFGLVLSLALGEIEPSAPGMIWEFTRVFVGGILAGLGFALPVFGLIRLLQAGPASSLVLMLSALGSFYVAEHLLGVSGIMSVTFTALLARYLLQREPEETLTHAAHTMEWLGVLLNAVLFTLMGLVITFEMFTHRWLAMLIAIIAALLARYATVFLACLASRLMGKPVIMGWQLVMGWGGIRGAVAIALVLALPHELPYWWTIQAMVFGVVLFGLLVQSGTLTPFITRLDTPAGDDGIRE